MRAAPVFRVLRGVPSLEDIYREHAPMIWRALRRFGVPEAVAPDLVHDVFLVVHRRLDEYDGRATMSSWLYGIARGVASNWRRGDGRTRRRLELASLQPVAEPPEPDEQIAKAQTGAMVDAFLSALDPAKREAFVLLEIEGMTGPEAADALGVKVDTVYSRVRKAREAFERMIERRRRGEARR